jgi:tetratricopeptide (TPR) repeat protein
MALVAGSSIALSVLLGMLTWRATIARNEARAARAQAELELVSERQTRAFLLSVFELADPNEARGQSITVREVLDRAVDRIDSTEFSRPVIRARFLATMGQAYARLGMNRRGADLLQQSLAALAAGPGAADEQSQALDSRLELADVLFDMGDYAAALEALAPLDPAAGAALPPSALQRARAATIRGDVYAYTDRDAEAAAEYERALGLLPGMRLSREESAAIESRAVGGLALLRHFAGDHAQAQALFGQVVALLLPVVGESHPDTIWALISLGSAAYAGGDRATARDSWLRAMQIASRVLDEDNPEVGTLKNNVGRLLLEDGDYAEAELLLRDALASDRRHRVENFDDLAFTLHNLALTRLAQGDALEAGSLLREAQAVAEASGHRMLGPILAALADIACADGRTAEGLEAVQRATELVASTYGQADWRHAQASLITASCLARDPRNRVPDTWLSAYCRMVGQWGETGYFADQARRLAEPLGPALPRAAACPPGVTE